MKTTFFTAFKYIAAIIGLLLLQACILSAFALIPNVEFVLELTICIACILLCYILLKKTFKSYPTPLKTKNWLIIIGLNLFIVCIIALGWIFSLSVSKIGFFSSYAHKYKFKNITFYTYKVWFGTNLRYSEGCELISHEIGNGFLDIEDPDLITIKQNDTAFLILSNREFIFSPKAPDSLRAFQHNVPQP